MTGAIRTGCGGWTFEPWRGVFFPPTVKQKDELRYMSRQLRSIDINLHVAHPASSRFSDLWRRHSSYGFGRNANPPLSPFLLTSVPRIEPSA